MPKLNFWGCAFRPCIAPFVTYRCSRSLAIPFFKASPQGLTAYFCRLAMDLHSITTECPVLCGSITGLGCFAHCRARLCENVRNCTWRHPGASRQHEHCAPRPMHDSSLLIVRHPLVARVARAARCKEGDGFNNGSTLLVATAQRYLWSAILLSLCHRGTKSCSKSAKGNRPWLGCRSAGRRTSEWWQLESLDSG